MPLVTPSRQSVNSYNLAGQWLTALGWPNTPSNRRALAAWFMSESGRSGQNVNVVGNNPLNISSKSGNYRVVRGHYIVVYATQAESIAAFKALITSPRHRANNYPGVVAAFNNSPTNGANVISAIINTGWVTGGNGPSYWHYNKQHERVNLLSSVFNSLPGVGGTSNPPPSGGDRGGGTTPPITTTAPAFLSDPTHVITADDIAGWKAWLLGNSGFDPNAPPAFAGGPNQYNAFSHYLDTVFTPTNFGAYQVKGQTVQQVREHFGSSGTKLFAGITPSDVGGFNLDPLSATAKWLLENVVPILAIIGGGALGLFGIYLVTKEATATGGTSAQSMVSPVPIFIREHV